MSYLVCDKCGGYYELQPGELPADFSDECECGGKLNFTEALKKNICPKCGYINPHHVKNCDKCGIYLGGTYSESSFNTIEIDASSIRIYIKVGGKISDVYQYELDKITDFSIVKESSGYKINFNYENNRVNFKISSKQAFNLKQTNRINVSQEMVGCTNHNCKHIGLLNEVEKCPKCGKKSKRIDIDSYKKLNSAKRQKRIKSTEKRRKKKTSKSKKTQNSSKKSSGKNAAIALGIICCVGLVIIIMFGGMIFPESSKTFTGSTMSFKYPSDWNVYSQSPTSVTLNNGGKEVYVETTTNSLQWQISLILVDGYSYKGDDDASGTKYKVYEFEGGYDPPTEFIFQKNGKTFEVMGLSSDTYVMEKIVATIN